jgi:UDP-MurNAc hydroxylase
MQITYLGHAGFCVETSAALIIMDPWLSPTGAFDSAWFQFPRNHHLAAYVQEKLQDARKERFLYISHEHKDHFDVAFLNSLKCREFTFVVPGFRRDELRSALAAYDCKGIISCSHREEVPIPGGFLKLFLDDSEMNRDSAILVNAHGRSFLNLNDCKLIDELPEICHEHEPIDVFAAQFSGATWHPTCYDYPRETYERISRRKMVGKFESLARAIELLHPRVYLPSAGPACFLDPMLIRLNFERVNIFPRASRLIRYLDRRLGRVSCTYTEVMPGDVLDADSSDFLFRARDRVDDASFEAYIRQYASLYEPLFRERECRYSAQDVAQVRARLREELCQKLELFTLNERIHVPLYFCLSEADDLMLRVDFPCKQIQYTSAIEESEYYSITAPAWQVARVLDRRLTWEDFALTLRARLNREPDDYQVLIHGFLLMEAEDLGWFCKKRLEIESQQERCIVEAAGCRYSVNRHCPHEGADLCHAWVEDGRYLTCPRHRWQFDLMKAGQCTTNETTIQAIPLEES